MKKIFFLLIIISLITFSCSRDFDEPNPNQATISSFWKTSTDAVQGVNAIYSTFHRGYAGFSRAMYFHGMLKGDEGYGSGGDIGLNTLMSFSMNDANFGLTADTWNNLYVGVYRANQVIAYVPNIQMDESLKKRLIGEAKFLRGLFYFYLTLYFGRPPLVLEPSQPNLQPRNATPEEAWAQVAKDFTEAAADLPTSYGPDDLGRATKGAAYAFLGKTYLQQKKYAEAATAFAWLVTGPGASIYDLMPNYRDNFLITTENNKESVFEIQNARKDDENGDDDINPGIRMNVGASISKFYAPGGGPGFQDGAVRRWVVNEFHLEKTETGQRDPRLAATFLYDSTDVGGPTATMVYGQTWASRYPNGNSMVYYRKLLNDHWRNTEIFNSPNNYRMIRYADVLLMYAEALNGQGQTAAAYPYVDRVRQRAGLKKLSDVMPGLTQAQFLQQLKHERITELSGEAWRFADLARWGDLSPTLQSRDAEFRNFVVGKHELYPIPRRDIDLNPNLTQNPGY
ncbi:MAG: RagB/SusD family nutrient uptake outer membrane protein [Flavisolibacter sp.]|nr:RagB/SusD family nutrient uptake outer membrane protein [Flavisolibacter sp.]MBD0295279.1 RagB/SusD family nutrient uptake outer membrane protein [Flavisolibacter sp.]